MGKRTRLAESSPRDGKEERPHSLIIRAPELISEILALSGGQRRRTQIILEAAVRLGIYHLKRSRDVCVALGIDCAALSPAVEEENTVKEDGADDDLLGLIV